MKSNKPPVLFSINTYIAAQDLYTTQTLLQLTTKSSNSLYPFQGLISKNITFPHLVKEYITLKSKYHCTYPNSEVRHYIRLYNA